MITIYAERCNGCGACVEVCPDGALYLVDNRVAVDAALCHDCGVCIAACPREALVLADEVRAPEKEPLRMPVPRPEPEVIQVKTESAPLPLRAQVLPLVGAALSWAGRELVPRVAEFLLDSLDRQTARQQTASTASRSGRGGGRRRQRQRRGRGGRD